MSGLKILVPWYAYPPHSKRTGRRPLSVAVGNNSRSEEEGAGGRDPRPRQRRGRIRKRGWNPCHQVGSWQGCVGWKSYFSAPGQETGRNLRLGHFIQQLWLASSSQIT